MKWLIIIFLGIVTLSLSSYALGASTVLNFTDSTNHSARYNMSGQTALTPTFAEGMSGTLLVATNYTSLSITDTNYYNLTQPTTNNEPRLQMFFKIPNKIRLNASISSIRFYYNGSENAAEAGSCYIANWTNNSFMNIGVIPTAYGNGISSTHTGLNISNFINSTNGNVTFVCLGENFDSGDIVSTNYVELLVNYTYNITLNSPSINASTVLIDNLINHSVTINTTGSIDTYKFAWNATGASCDTWANVTNYTSGLNGANIIVYANQTIPSACDGKTIGWQIWANTTTGDVNASIIASYNVTTRSAPINSNILNYSIGNDSVIIGWNKNIVSNASLYYGTSLALSSSVLNVTQDTKINITLTGLSNNTLYYFNISSCNVPANNCTTNGSFSFFTLNNSIAPTNTCTYSGVGDWIINSSDYCNITNDTTVQGWIYVRGFVGVTQFFSNIKSWGLYKYNNNTLIIKPGQDNNLLLYLPMVSESSNYTYTKDYSSYNRNISIVGANLSYNASSSAFTFRPNLTQASYFRFNTSGLAPLANYSNFTLSGWVFVENKTVSGASFNIFGSVISQVQGNSRNGTALQLLNFSSGGAENTTHINIQFIATNESGNILSGNSLITNFTRYQWHHVVGTRANQTYRLYVDGILIKENNATGNLTDGLESSPYMIGYFGGYPSANPSTSLNGSVRYIKILNTTWNPTEVNTEYNFGASKLFFINPNADTTLLLSAPFNSETSNSTYTKDYSNYNDYFSNVSATYINGYYRFNSSLNTGMIVNYNTIFDNHNNYSAGLSYGAWVNFDDKHAFSNIVSYGKTAESVPYTGVWGLTIRNQDGVIRCVLDYNTTNLTVATLNISTLSGWNHYWCNINSTHNSLYLNGIYNTTSTYPVPISLNVSNNISIGYDYTRATDGRMFTNGSIDNVKVYNRSLSDDEIYREYNIIGRG